MKRYIYAKSERIDLSKEKNIGYEIIDELRQYYPEIPHKIRYRRSRAWSTHWYVMFDLGININQLAQEYRDSIDPTNDELRRQYIKEFEDRCEEICSRPEYYNYDSVQCSVDWWGDPRTDMRTENAVLYVFSRTNPVEEW